MRIKLLLILVLAIITFTSKSQNTLQSTLTHQVCTQELIPLTFAEEQMLKELPELKLPAGYNTRSLPPVIDNSQYPYFRPVFNQDEYCCGQAAGIAYNFTYEIDRARDLPANVPDNQYPTHFAWNWLNSGYGYFGVSYFHSFQVLKHVGMPNVTDYGGTLSYGGNDRWLSGYDNYYNGMHNRINNAYQIYVGDPEGLDVFKQWLVDHHDGSAIGGVGNFYAQYMAANNQLPAGTPEAGKYVLITFGGSANHAMTIVGYNDSIRFDYNGDSQYTNDIDINGDGIVDMKDWEIGGFKMAQSYGGVPGWGDQGFAYMMYKTVADDLGSGGIWNHCVHVLDAKEDCDPQLTMKVTLEHNKRNAIKVTAGISTDINAVQPDYVLEFPILNYQGGSLFMQGGTSVPANKTIEFGLDITPLLSEILPAQNAKFFLQVDEDDPSGAGTGTIVSYSIIDYTNGTLEIPCSQSNVPLNENDITRLSIVASINFDKVEVTNASLPVASIGSYYNQQMIANNGAVPYRWHLYRIYDESSSTGTFPNITQNQLSPPNSTNGFVTQSIDFDFPFYDSTYQNITVHVDGYLMFDEQLYPYPYFNDDMVLFTTTRHISPFMTQELRLYSSMGDGIWYEGDQNSATFRWQAHLDGQTSYEVNMAVSLYPSGDIEFYYDYVHVPGNLLWIPGISDGDDETYQFASPYGNAVPIPGDIIDLAPYNYPPELSLSEEGILSGTMQQAYNNVDLTFRVTDNNFIHNFRTLPFSTSGIIIEDSVSSGGDEIIEFGESAMLSIRLTNIQPNPVYNATMTISSEDSLITITDSVEVLGSLPSGVPVNFEDAFSFDIDPGIPNNYPIQIQTNINGNRETWESNLYYIGFAPEVLINEVIVMDSANGYLDPGEDTDLFIDLENNGGASATNIIATLSTADPYIIIHDGIDTLLILSPDSSASCIYHISVSEDAPIGHIVHFNLDLMADMNYTAQDSFNLDIGRTLENFETGDFSAFSWGFDGRKDWRITDNSPYEGFFSARSGYITHNDESSMIIDINVMSDGELSFYKKVSCEDDANNDNFDYLSFIINGNEVDRWDGEHAWSQESYSISTGYHRLEWRYHKDDDVSSGFDCAWVDFISFPSSADAYPAILYDPDNVYMALKPDQQGSEELSMENAGEGGISYDIWISSIPGKSSSISNRSILGSYLEYDIEVIHAGEQQIINLTVYNTSIDNEWIEDINLYFPDDADLFSASDFVGGSGGDMIWDGATGFGVTTNWHGEDGNGWGVIKPGETAYAEIVIFVPESSTTDLSIYFEVIGDIYGAEPHIITGDLNMVNLGPLISWISLESDYGTVQGNTVFSNMVYFDSEGMSDGEYHCELIVNEQFQIVKIIPVTLLVDQNLGILISGLSQKELSVYPNPFRQNARIEYHQETSGVVDLRIYDLRGNLIRILINHVDIPSGKHSILWDGKDNDGFQVPEGVYIISLVQSGNQHFIKTLKID